MRNKYFMLAVMLVFPVLNCLSQDGIGGNSLRLETGYAFTGSGDLDGFCYYNEFMQPLTSWFSVAPSIGFYSFSTTICPCTGISLKGVYQNDTRGIVVATARVGLNIIF